MRILNNSPSVHLATEIHYFSSLFHNGFLKNLGKAKRRSEPLPIETLIHCIQMRNHFGMYWHQNRHFPADGIRAYFRNKLLTERNIYKYLMELDFEENSKGKTEIRYIGEKTPLNIFHVRRLFRWFPDAKILYILRNPMDVLKSEVNKDHKPDYPVSKANPLYAYGLVIFVFVEWLLASLIALYNSNSRKHNFIIVAYEKLVSDCEESICKIASLLDIEYTEDLCKVRKAGSSFSRPKREGYWYPPRWVIGLYQFLLFPIFRLLNKASLTNP
jgi:hypothetical protein